MIRRAVKADADGARDVVLAAYQHYIAIIGSAPGPMQDDYLVRVAADQVWIIDDELGIAGVLVLEDQPDCFLLDNIAVRPDRQGTGLGRLLLDFAETHALASGHETITLYTNALMTDNIAIYGKRGYEEQARRTEKGFDRVYMAKRLVGG